MALGLHNGRDVANEARGLRDAHGARVDVGHVELLLQVLGGHEADLPVGADVEPRARHLLKLHHASTLRHHEIGLDAHVAQHALQLAAVVRVVEAEREGANDVGRGTRRALHLLAGGLELLHQALPLRALVPACVPSCDDADVTVLAERAAEVLPHPRECQRSAAIRGVIDSVQHLVARAVLQVVLLPCQRAVDVKGAQARGGDGRRGLAPRLVRDRQDCLRVLRGLRDRPPGAQEQEAGPARHHHGSALAG
mmetsp:Transcript_78796/g.202962  ORF Transcript_78796/g.202962 Transcript_78796/m.202962 type:complete len:252 (+) Transcript_78796:278-1033(+)